MCVVYSPLLEEIKNSCVCVYSYSRNDVLRVAQRYRTIGAHTRRRASVLVVFVVFLLAYVQFCRFDKADATANVQWHCNHRPSLWYHYFPAQRSLGADILVYWIGKIVRTCAPGGSRTRDLLHARRAPYPLGQALRIKNSSIFCSYLYSFYGIFYACIVWILCEPPSHKFGWAWCLDGVSELGFNVPPTTRSYGDGTSV